MGQRNTRSMQPASDLDPSEWVTQNFVSNEPGALEYGRMRTLKNRQTNELVDRYEDTLITQKDYQDYLLSYQWRRNEPNIVRAYHLDSKNANRYCSTTYNVSIYIEHPKNRLSDFSDIPFPDTMYCLRAMLIGYGKLYEHVGAFPVKEEQVCIDDAGNLKVWLNRDLSKNYPEEWEIEPTNQSADENEEDMVSQIVAVVARNSDTELEPSPSFIKFYENNRMHRKIGFDEALQLVEEYTDNNGSEIPNYFTSVVEVYEHQEGLYEMEGGQQPGTNASYHNNEESDGYGQITERQIQRRNQLFQGSQVQQLTYNSHKSRASKTSQIQNLNRPIKNQMLNNLNNSMSSERNKGQTYRLSGLSELDGEEKVVTTYQPLKSYNPSGNNVYRPSDAVSNNPNNFSQISYNNAILKPNETPVWMSLKPQQPYIPSSPTYLHMNMNTNTNTEQPSLLAQLNNTHTVRTEGTHREDSKRIVANGNGNGSRSMNKSISERQDESNMSRSNGGGEDFINLRFQRELDEEIAQERHDVDVRDRSMRGQQYRPLPRGENSRQINHNLEVIPAMNKNTSQNSMRVSSKQGANESSILPKTAQFIQSSYNQGSNPSSQLPAMSKSSSAQGFTIVIKSPSQQQLVHYGPQFPQYVPTMGGIPPSSVRMVKNNSQPFLPASPAFPMNFVPLPQLQQPTLPQFPVSQPHSARNYYGVSQEKENSDRKIKSTVEKDKNKDKVQTTYCTVKQQIALDPQIINDMLLYI